MIILLSELIVPEVAPEKLAPMSNGTFMTLDIHCYSHHLLPGCSVYLKSVLT